MQDARLKIARCCPKRYSGGIETQRGIFSENCKYFSGKWDNEYLKRYSYQKGRY